MIIFEMKLTKNMDNQEISRLLRSVSAAYEVMGENRFRIRAYDNAADSVEHASREVKDLWDESKLSHLPGVGPNIASHLDELFKTGNVRHFESLFKKLPGAMFELLDVPGVGPKTALKLTKSLGISKAHGAVARLKKAAQKGKIRNIEGFGEESESQIIKGIEEFERRENRMTLVEATRLTKEMVEYMRREKAVMRVDPLGSLRRRAASVGDIDLGVVTKEPSKAIEHFKRFPGGKQVLAAGKNTARLIHRSGRQIDIKTQSSRRYGALLQHFTGSKAHNIHLREIALEKGLSLSEHGIKAKGKVREYRTEDAFYKAIGMQWIPPELREDSGEIEAAMKHSLPKLIEPTDIKGDLHLHTNYGWQSSHDSGENEMKAMIEKAIELGYDYVGIGDHNPSTSAYSQTQLVEEVKKRSKLIEQIKYSNENSKSGRSIHVLNTLEVDIHSDGKLALPDEALEMLDYAVVSVHSSMRMSKAAMTERILKGMSHPKAKILGHPTGRLLNKREGYEVDWEKIFSFVKENGKFLEINAWPARLDLPDTLARLAVADGVQLAIDTDSHAVEHMELMRYGVDVARRAWCKTGDILNAHSFENVKAMLLS